MMYIIIAGCGRVGANLAKKLSQDGHDVAIIDHNSSSFDRLGNGFNGMTVIGMPIDEDTLRQAGIEHADALAAVTSDDNMNIMTSQIARQLYHVKTVITRSYDPEREEVLIRMGLDTICPTTLAVDMFSDMLTGGSQK
ncbi:MAG: TrkA family potassium uptake protein [Clostridia bacterium]